MVRTWMWTALFVSLLTTACSQSGEARYRVSYSVNDNGVTRSASGVWSSVVRTATIPLASKYTSEFHGEAIPLRLSRRGLLLLMPIGDQGIEGGTMVRRLFSHRSSVVDSDRTGNTAAIGRLVGETRPIRCARYGTPQPTAEPREIPGEDCLNFMFFSDPDNPSTLRRIQIVDGQFNSLNGVRLTRATVTITTRPVTRRLVDLLRWLPSLQ